MRAPRFWQASAAGPAAIALAPLALIHDAATRIRFRVTKPRKASLPVLCVGNFTAGGAGKTPVAMALAGLLAEKGLAPAFLTRGYGGRLAGPVVVDPAAHDAADVGDEALLLARVAPTVVARARVSGAALAATTGASVLIMDDGLQNPTLAKTVALAVIDGESGIGNGRVIPAGPLRAGLAFQLSLIDACVLSGEGAAGAAAAERARVAGHALFRGAIRTETAFAGEAVVAFAGIGRPEKFFRLLEERGARLVARRAFGDHHVYTASEAGALMALAEGEGARLVTTEKDLVRLKGRGAAAGGLADVASTLPVRFVFDEPERIVAFLEKRIGAG